MSLIRCFDIKSGTNINICSLVKQDIIGLDGNIRIGYCYIALWLKVCDMFADLYVFRMVFSFC